MVSKVKVFCTVFVEVQVCDCLVVVCDLFESFKFLEVHLPENCTDF